MSIALARERTSAARRSRSWAATARHVVGGFYLVMAGINAGIVAADPQTYRTFADGAFRPFVTDAWHTVVMERPHLWFLLLAAGEVVLGLLLLRGGRAARAGWVGVIVFHVLLMSFGFGIWLWSVPALAFLVPSARADWPALSPGSPEPRPARLRQTGAREPAGDPMPASQGRSGLWSAVTLGTLVVAASLYGLLADTPYRSLPDSTVLAARAQDACSIVVAVLLVAIAARPMLGVTGRLLRLGLLGYLTYSYLIYVTGVPMNRMFLAYVAIVALSGASLAGGLAEVVSIPPPARPTRRLRLGTGWMLVVTAGLFAMLWLSVLLPFALGGAPVDPAGVGGTPYPVFWLDLAIVLPAIAAVGILLLRDRPAGPPLAMVALVKIITLFTALWAGPLLTAVTGGDVVLDPDAGPSLVLLAASSLLVVHWSRALAPTEVPEVRAQRP